MIYKLKPNLLLMLAAILSLLAAAGFWFSYVNYKRSATAYQRANFNLETAQQRYFSHAADTELVQQYQRQFNTLQQRAIVGEEDRLSWAEALHQVNHYAINSTATNIAPKRRLEQIASADNLHWHLSAQQIKIELLHEGGFFHFFEQFFKRANGLAELESCHLKRATKVQILAAANNITVNCTINWFSVTLGDEL